MKVDEIRELTLDELEEKLKDGKAELFNLKFQLATGQLDNAVKIRHVRKDIARVRTVIRQREMDPALEPKKRAEPKKDKAKPKPAAAKPKAVARGKGAQAKAKPGEKPTVRKAAASTGAEKTTRKATASKKASPAKKVVKKTDAVPDKDAKE